MATGYHDLPVDLNVVQFKIDLGKPALSVGFQDIEIPYTGYGDPELTNVELTRYQFSLDGGVTWEDMNPSVGTSLTGLTFSPSGTSQSFVWEARAQIEGQFYNTTIKIALQATSGSITTLDTMRTLGFNRNTSDQSQENASPFPEGYKGTPGYVLMEKAPKSDVR